MSTSGRFFFVFDLTYGSIPQKPVNIRKPSAGTDLSGNTLQASCHCLGRCCVSVVSHVVNRSSHNQLFLSIRRLQRNSFVTLCRSVARSINPAVRLRKSYLPGPTVYRRQEMLYIGLTSDWFFNTCRCCAAARLMNQLRFVPFLKSYIEQHYTYMSPKLFTSATKLVNIKTYDD